MSSEDMKCTQYQEYSNRELKEEDNMKSGASDPASDVLYLVYMPVNLSVTRLCKFYCSTMILKVVAFVLTAWDRHFCTVLDRNGSILRHIQLMHI